MACLRSYHELLTLKGCMGEEERVTRSFVSLSFIKLDPKFTS